MTKKKIDPRATTATIRSGVDIDAEQVTIGGDVVGRDKIVAAGEIAGVVINSAPGFRVPGMVALHQLPPPPADFTGREFELSALPSVVEKGTTLLSLHGMGGVGKTTLALKLAEALSARYPDAQIFLDLRGTSPDPLSPRDAMAHVIRAYHPSEMLPENESEISVLYRSVLHGQRALLLMDNAANGKQVEPLIPPSTCLLLITSRQKFRLPGLFVTNLDALPVDDARKLLLTIEPRIGERADAIAELCDYLPLALRLVAAALAERPDLALGAFEQQLRDARKALGLTGAETSLTLSYARLEPSLQKQWRLLSVFSGTFDAEAAAGIWETESGRAVDSLTELLRFSLVDYLPSTKRYRMLPLVRAFADTRMDSSERNDAAFRHARHFLRILHRANDLYIEGDYANGQALLEGAWSNIQAGQSWAATHMFEDDSAAQLCNDYPRAGESVLQIRLTPRELARWSDEALAAARQLKDRTAEGVHLGSLGLAYAALGETRRAIEFYEQALVIAREIGDRRGEGNALGSLGNAHAALGETRRAIEFYEQALVIAREIGDRRGEGNVLDSLGNAYAALGETRRAIEFYEQALVIAREIGDRRGEGAGWGNLGLAYAALGETSRAIEFYEQRLVIAREIGDRRGEGNALGNLGNAYADLGDARQAIQFYQQALVIAREIGDRRGEGADLGNLGNAYYALGDARRAIEFYEQRLVIAREIGDRRGEGNALGNVGNAYLAVGEIARATKYYEQARVIAREIGDRIGEATVSGGLGRASLALGDIDKAIKHFEKQLVIVREIGDRRQEGNTLRNLGNAYSKLNESGRAVELYHQALDIVRGIGDLRTEGDVLWDLSQVEHNSGNHLQAVSAALDAFKIYERINAPDLELAYSASLKYLTDMDSEVRQFTIGAVVDRVANDATIRAAIVERLIDDDWHVRQAAVAALGQIAIGDVEIRRALLRRLEDTNSDVRQEVIKALSSLLATDPEVRAAIYPRISRPSYEQRSPCALAREFFSAAGFEVRELDDPLEFVCHPVPGVWEAKIDAPVYSKCLHGWHLDRNSVLQLYESAKRLTDAPRIIFVIIDQTPDESGLIEIGALRAAEGVQVVPVDDAIIQQGRELQKEYERLREYLLKFIGRGNRYEATTPVIDRLSFFGREIRTRELLDALSQGEPLALFGLRKMGKSSLVQHLRDSARFPVAYIDLQAGETLSALYNRILGFWQRSLRVRIPGFDWLPPRISQEPSSSFVTAALDLMTRLENSGHSSRLGLFIDEIEVIVPRGLGTSNTLDFEEVTRYMSFARALRGIVQETDRLSLLVVGVDPLLNRVTRLQGQQNPFYKFFREEYLGPLGREECIQMVRNIGRQMDLEFDDEAAQFVADISGGQPFWARQLCSATIETMGDALGSKIELSHLRNAAQRFIREPRTASLFNENGLWGEVTDPALWREPQVIENKSILTSLARSEPQVEEALLAGGHNREARESSMFELENRTVLSRLEQSLKIRFSLFRQWIEKYQLQAE